MPSREDELLLWFGVVSPLSQCPFPAYIGNVLVEEGWLCAVGLQSLDLRWFLSFKGAFQR